MLEEEKVDYETSDETEGTESYTTEETETDITSEITDDTEETTGHITEERKTHVTFVTSDDTITTETSENSADASVTLSSATDSNLEEDGSSDKHSLPDDFLQLDGRHIKSEDFEWGTSSVMSLSDIVVEAGDKIESSNLETFLKNTTDEQKLRILELLPLDLPLEVTLPILEDGIFWKRLCLKTWSSCDIWRYCDGWKSLFVHRSVQELIENFNPDKDNIQELCKNLQIYSEYVRYLKICKLMKAIPKKLDVDVDTENFDEQLDDIISARQSPTYLDFEKVFECLPQLESLTISLSPACIDFENFHFKNVDFNCLLKATRKLEKLQKFRASNGNFSNEQIVKFLQMFLGHNVLKELNLSFNFINDDMCYYVAKLLLSNLPLEKLSLMQNKITDTGAKIIASALFMESNLTTLDLSLNMIGDKGTVNITKALLKNAYLINLDLSKNKITAEGGAALAGLIKKSRILRSLNVQENFFGEEVGKQFAAAIEENDSLLELGIRFCGFRSEDEGRIHQTILQNRSKVSYSTYVKSHKDLAASTYLF